MKTPNTKSNLNNLSADVDAGINAFINNLNAKKKPAQAKQPVVASATDEALLEITMELSLLTLVITEICADAKIDLNACIQRARARFEKIASNVEKRATHPEGARIFSAQ